MMTVTEAALAAGLSRSRVDALIRSGRLRAERVGHQYLIDDPAQLLALTGRRGRPMAPRTAWGLLLHGDGLEAPWATSSDRSRLRVRVAALRADPEPETRLQALVVNRAVRLPFHAPEPEALLVDPAVQGSGLSDPRSGIAAGGGAEGYVGETDLAQVVRRHLLVEPRDNHPNVWLHVAPFVPPAPLRLQVAADLAEHGGPRERDRARAIIGEVLREGG